MKLLLENEKVKCVCDGYSIEETILRNGHLKTIVMLVYALTTALAQIKMRLLGTQEHICTT